MKRPPWLLFISFGVLSAFLLLIYFDADLENFYISILFKNRLAVLAIISIGLGSWFYRCAWRFVEDQYKHMLDVDPNPGPPNDRFRDIHIAQYNHLNAENTRCRNQIWKTVLSVWAIYYALILFAGGFASQPAGTNNLSLPIGWLLFFSFIAAFCATAFHVFFEIMAMSNQKRSQNLGQALGLIHATWTHQEVRGTGFLFSIIVFAALIWVPPLILLILTAGQR